MTRRDYYTQIYIYKNRREEYRKKYKGAVPIYRTKRYIKITSKMGQWAKEIKRLDARKEKIGRLFKAVNNYFNVNIKSRIRNIGHDLARKVYFKIGLEQRICGTHLERFIGRKVYCGLAAYSRRSLAKEFETKSKYKDSFYSFKLYLENENKVYTTIQRKTA